MHMDKKYKMKIVFVSKKMISFQMFPNYSITFKLGKH